MVRRSSTRFKKKLIHTCTFQVNTPGAVDTYGHKVPAWANSLTSIPCLFMPKAHQRESGKEVVTPGADVFIAGWTLFVDYNTTTKAITEEHRVTNIVLVSDSSVVEAGPIDIELVKDAAGQNHHLEIHLSQRPMGATEA